MICDNGLPFINKYVDKLNDILKLNNKKLTFRQLCWIKFILLGIIVTNTVCWSKIERFSLGNYSLNAISWMFRHSKIFWNNLLTASVTNLIKLYNITDCVLAIDDTDKSRSKNIKRIGMAHKIKDKKTSGYFMGQNIVKLLLISNGVSLPVGFRLYEPDPNLKKYKLELARLRKKKVPKIYWPKEVRRDSSLYKTKIELAIELLKEFTKNHNSVRINAIIADALYGSNYFVSEAKLISKQVITEVKSTQNIIVNNKTIQLAKFFAQYFGITTNLKLRYNNRLVNYVACKFKLKSHNEKRYVIAVKFDNEDSYRYIIATDMSWQATDIIQTFSLRWLIEVFIQDWKSYEGWGSMAKQPGVDGSIRGIILSLLCDHALLSHDEQIALFKKREPACTVGSLCEKVKIDSLLEFIKTIVNSDSPHELFNQYHIQINQFFKLKQSNKHIRNNNYPPQIYCTKNNMDILKVA